MLVHARDGHAVRINGGIVTGLSLKISPEISERLALDSALSAVSAGVYRWESPAWEARIKEFKNDPNATYYPQSELVIAQSSGQRDMLPDNYRLAYKFAIYSSVPYGGENIYIDARNGSVLKRVPLIPDISSGTAATLYNGSRTIITEYRSISNDYILNDDTRGDGVHTMRYVSESSNEDVTDLDNDWQSANQRPSASGHWAAEKTYDYFINVHNRNSFDTLGALIQVVANYQWCISVDEFGICDGWLIDNAGWDPSVEELQLGRGGADLASDDLVSLDIVGHEFSHAVDQYSGNLVYTDESGALEESFGDIFGTMVEFYVEGGSGNYQIAEDMWIPDGFLRDMSDPHAGTVGKRQPDTYGTNDPFWCTDPESCEAGDIVHTNSGVQNYWFYLLAEGGTGSNSNGDSYSVVSIGRDTVAAIAYRNLTQYLTSTSDYADAREGSIWAASDLYGSTEVAQVENAWQAVGVGPSLPYDIVLQNETVTADTLIYVAGNTITAGPAYTINSGRVLLLAKNSITLKPGFHAKAGSKFTAYVGPVDIPPPLSAPTGLIIVNAGGELGENPILTWTSVTDAESYNVSRQFASGGWGNIASVSVTLYTDVQAVLNSSSQDLLEYYVTAVNPYDESGPSDTVSAFGSLQKARLGLPATYALHHAYPNPFNPTVTIRYDLPEPANVTLVVYNLLGREVVRLVDGPLGPAYHQVVWRGRDRNGREVPSGLYIARLVARPAGQARLVARPVGKPAFTQSVKMVLLR